MRSLLVLVASLSSALAACPGPTGPSDEAIARYVGDAGSAATSPGATTPSTTPAGATRPAPPTGRAKRLAVTVERATGVPDHDTGPGDSDVYVALALDGQRFRTTVASAPDPSWGDSTVFDARPGATLEVALMDEDSLSSDEKIGIQAVPLPELAEGETTTLEVAYKNGESGRVFITVTGIGRP
ncbi:MAG: hypothetical protein IT385_02660 [Deltaproteobacteria bacterium]|nr:hypothetical protein [Deltaproteobacteria bacterium]